MTAPNAAYSRGSTTECPRDSMAATERLKGAGEKAQEAASDVAGQARQYAEKAQEAARQFKPFVARSLKEQPMTTLAGAAVIGFVLGALWKR